VKLTSSMVLRRSGEISDAHGGGLNTISAVPCSGALKSKVGRLDDVIGCSQAPNHHPCWPVASQRYP